MAQLLFANNATTTLAGPISSTATTCNVAAGSGTLFPQPGQGQYFKLTFIDAQTKTLREIVHVTAVSGDAFTIARGQEGTSQLAWNGGDVAANLITAGTFAAFAQTANLPTSFVAGQDSGTANAVQVAQTTPAVSSPSAGQLFLITKGTSANTGPVTFQIGSGTQYGVVYKDGSALGGGDWPAGAAAVLYFNGGVMQFVACQGNPQVKTYFGRAAGTPNAATVATVPTMLSLVDGHILTYVTGASPNTAAPTVNPCGLGAVPVVRFDDSQLAAGDLPGYVAVPVQYDGGLQVYRLLWPVTPTQVPKILAPGTTTTLYFRSDGSDSNNGATNSASGAFRTLGALINYATSQFSFAGGVVVAQMGVTGTYAAPSAYAATLGQINVQGVSGSVSASVISGTNVSAAQCNLQFSGVNLVNTGSGPTLNIGNGGTVTLVAPVMVSVQNNGIGFQTGPGGSLVVDGLTYSGNSQYAFYANGGAITIGAAPITFQGTPSFSGSVVLAGAAGVYLTISGASYSGSVSGTSYVANYNGVILTAGVTIPGSAGTTSTGGQKG